VVFIDLPPHASPDLVGRKRLSIEHSKSYPTVFVWKKSAQNKPRNLKSSGTLFVIELFTVTAIR